MPSYILQFKNGDTFLQRLKVAAAMSGKSMKDFIIDAVNAAIDACDNSKTQKRK